MSDRSEICKSFSDKISDEMTGTGDTYITNLYTNVTNKLTFFEDIHDYPYVTVTPGPEQRSDQPSNFTWCVMQMYVRVFVENQDDAQGELEQIISDLEIFLDNNLALEYNKRIPGGSTTTRKTTDNTIVSITTDEGLMDPRAVGEIVVDVRYTKIRN